jgi:magnesium-transporting ATPase (P-type)
MENQKLDTIIFRKTALSKDELNRIYKYRNNKIIQWVFLLAVVLLLLVIMIFYLTKEFMNSLSIDIIWDILFVVLFIYIAILCMKNIRKLRNIKIDSLSVRRAVITEKQSVKSKDLINRSRNRFVAAKIDDTIRVIVL